MGDKKIDRGACYIPPQMDHIVQEWSDGAETGQTSWARDLDDVFAWKTQMVNAWYGWANDGKGTFFDFMAVLKAKMDGDKFCFFKQEDMNAIRQKEDGKWKTRMSGNDIYNNLVWQLTGKTPYKHFAKKYFCPQLTLEELQEAMMWVMDHFFVIYPQDRRYKSVEDDFRFMHERFGIKHFLIDPFKSLILDESGRTDFMMNQIFISGKEFALETDTSLHFIAHPKSMTDVKVSNKEDAAYKVVNQFMIAGGAAWDNNMDAQYSIYRPERHLNPSNPLVHFHNLKQRKSEIVGVRRGSYEKIKFDFLTKRYFFGDEWTCPLDGSKKDKTTNSVKPMNQQDIFGAAPATDELPF